MADTSPAWNCDWNHVRVMASHSVGAGNNVWQNQDPPGERRLTDAWSAIHPAIEAMISLLAPVAAENGFVAMVASIVMVASYGGDLASKHARDF